jgi:hypothetical protein
MVAGSLANAERALERSTGTLRRALRVVERVGGLLGGATRTLERPEAVIAADGASSLLSLAGDELRDGLTRLAAIGEAELAEEVAIRAAVARGERRRPEG